jgi:hypothetical protein
VEIGAIGDVEPALRALGLVPAKVLVCAPKQVLLGLHMAKRNRRRLVIDENAPMLLHPTLGTSGLFIVEDVQDNIGSVVGVNFAFSVGADVYFTEPLEHDERRDIREGLIAWKGSDSDRDYQIIRGKIGRRIGALEFRRFTYVTFVTEGLPYSIGMANDIPCSYLDLFDAHLTVCNSISAEKAQDYNVALVFSVDEFVQDGEVQWLFAHLQREGYFVRSLVGETATVRNLDYNVQHFPYSLLHISSHGGAIEGYVVSQPFVDRAGVEHRVEYDEVVTFAPGPGSDLVRVSRKVFPRKLDGLRWRSSDLKHRRLSEYVFDDMMIAILNVEAGGVRNVTKAQISGSCGISCHDQTYQGLIQVLACHTSPVVFNNTCWSAADIGDFFINSGARGYIGTLWAVGNETATLAAEAFYRSASTTTLMEATHAANSVIQSIGDRDIYVYFGAHFSTLRARVPPDASRDAVFKRLTKMTFQMIDQAGKARSAEIKRNALEAVDQMRSDIRRSFDVVNLADLERDIDAALAAVRRA